MAYKLEKPFEEIELTDFIVEYNHNRGLLIEETQNAYYALEPNEIMQNGIPIINPNFDEERRQAEAERIQSLTVTKRVFAIALKEFGISYSQLKELIASNEDAQLEWDLCERLHRNNPLLDVMASQLGVTPEQLDEIFVLANQESEV